MVGGVPNKGTGGQITGTLESVPSGRDFLLKDLKLFFCLILISSKNTKCRRKKLAPKVCTESGKKWGYGLRGVIDLRKDFAFI